MPYFGNGSLSRGAETISTPCRLGVRSGHKRHVCLPPDSRRHENYVGLGYKDPSRGTFDPRFNLIDMQSNPSIGRAEALPRAMLAYMTDTSDLFNALPA